MTRILQKKRAESLPKYDNDTSKKLHKNSAKHDEDSAKKRAESLPKYNNDTSKKLHKNTTKHSQNIPASRISGASYISIYIYIYLRIFAREFI